MFGFCYGNTSVTEYCVDSIDIVSNVFILLKLFFQHVLLK